MRKILNVAIMVGVGSLSLSVPAAAGAAPLSTWYGHYIWEEPLGRIGGAAPTEGISAFITYDLKLGRAAGPTGCLLSAEGFQTYQHMRCTATPHGNAVTVKYYGTAGESHRVTYRRGASLFSLTRAGRGIVTQLAALQPSSDAMYAPGLVAATDFS